MALSDAALFETRDAFDGVAHDYDRANTENPILCAMRRRTLDALTTFVPRGARVIDLGCGPGTDEACLVRAGYYVTAIDWSPAMVEEAKQRVRAEQLADRVSVRQLGIHQIEQLAPARFDAAYSNFGPLNCVPDLDDTARQLAARLRLGGTLVASVIGRVCPWEMALYLARGETERARIRFAPDAVAVPLRGRSVWTRYYSPGEFEAVFRTAGFTTISCRALGLCAPPPYMEGFAHRHPRLTAALHRLDDVVGGWPGLRACGDHFLIVMRRV